MPPVRVQIAGTRRQPTSRRRSISDLGTVEHAHWRRVMSLFYMDVYGSDTTHLCLLRLNGNPLRITQCLLAYHQTKRKAGNTALWQHNTMRGTKPDQQHSRQEHMGRLGRPTRG